MLKVALVPGEIVRGLPVEATVHIYGRIASGDAEERTVEIIMTLIS